MAEGGRFYFVLGTGGAEVRNPANRVIFNIQPPKGDDAVTPQAFEDRMVRLVDELNALHDAGRVMPELAS